MIIRKLIAGLVSMLFIMAMLAACDSTAETPATGDTIALPPNATPLPAGSNSLADQVADEYRKAMAQKNVKMDLQMYTLPNAVSWEQIQGFYTKSMKADWQPEATLTHDAGSFKTIGWTRGSAPGRQGAAIGYGPADLGKPPFLMVVLFSE